MTPAVISDTYNVTLTTVFATEVPFPVVTVNPSSIDLCQITGDSEQINLVVTNNGLISADDLQMAIDESNPDWSIVPLSTNLGNLAAESSIVVPVIITRLGTTPIVLQHFGCDQLGCARAFAEPDRIQIHAHIHL